MDLSLALFIPLPANMLPNKLAPNNILRNPPLCSLASFWIVLLIPNNEPESSRDLAVYIMSSIS